MAKAYVIGTCDTKGRELAYLKRLLEGAGVPTILVDVGTRSGGTQSGGTGADVS
ncbi:MAG: Tm-1-like ATP-binding domain-containing protein, partial [Geminicoccaceae bacterium]